jgi:hypothetical protein
MNSWIDIASLGKVLAASLIGGVGLAVFFSVGLVGVSAAVGNIDDNAGSATPAKASGWVLAAIGFIIVALGIAAGLYVVLTD